MATLHFIILAAACLAANAFPQNPRPYRNTIFGDEKLEGEAFENMDAFDEFTKLSRSEGPVSPYRLPTTTKPEHYDIVWTVQFPERVFSGEVDIQLYSTQPGVNEIVVQSNELNITSYELRLGNTVIPVRLVEQPEYQFLRLQLLDGTLGFNGIGSNKIIYTLRFTFNAPLRKDMYGIYESWFRNNATDVEVSWMASTQFQATYARYAFPCYDEPSFKATFSIVIGRPQTYTSWTGMKRESFRPSTRLAGYVEDVYFITPVQSTYLLAILVAEYQSNAVTNSNGDVVYEVIARPGAMANNQSHYAFNVGQDLLAEMSDHTAMDFYSVHPHVKMTQAAIPDFSAGAMENWGLLTYREAYLMYDEDHSNGQSKQLIAYILSHEIAHMWFGNLATCEWWDTLWLNEGFARYYQYFLTDWVEPHLGLGIRFINEQVHTSLLSDSANNPQPLTNPGVGSPSSVSAMFSTISYNKGAAVIRQTEHLLGFNVHREGLRRYLVDRAFNVAEPIHLFQALQNTAVTAGAISQYGPDFNIIDYYKTWTEQGGHPVLNVEVNHQTGEMTIYQRRFNINSGYSTATTNWIVPITFATASNPDFENTKPTHIIKEAITKINRGSIGDQWVIFNKQQTGYYRVNYDDYTWNLIVMALRGPSRTQIHEYNRAQIVNDVFQFARSGLMTYSRAFNILSFLEEETEYTPWVAAITGFNWIRNRLVNSSYLPRLEALMARWASKAMGQLSYDPNPNESFMRSYLRYQLAPFMCNLNQNACRQSALQQFRALRLNSENEVPVDSRNWVYCNALRQGTVEDFDFLWNRYLTHNVYTEKILLLQTLGCTPHEASLNKLLEALVDENFDIRRQDYTNTFSVAVSGNEGNTQIVFRFIQANLRRVGAAFGTILNPNNYATPLSYITPRLRTVQQIQEFQTWATNNRGELGNSYNSIYNSAEATRQSLLWAGEVQSDMESYLNFGGETYLTTTSAPVIPVVTSTVTPPPLVEPLSPELPVPDSASTSFLSVLVMALAVAANFVW